MSTLKELLVFAVIGLAAGSFFNVCISRMPKNASIIFPPSHCPKCRHRLGLMDLVPVFSYFFLSGKCRYCGRKISFRYPLVEVLTAVVFAMLFLKFGVSVDLLFYLLIASILIVISFIDIDCLAMPEDLLIAGVALGALFSIFKGRLVESLISVSFGFALMFAISYLARVHYRKEALGDGDIKLVVMLGTFLTAEKLAASLMMASLAGAAVAITLILLKKTKRKDYIPFGPFLSLGALIAIML